MQVGFIANLKAIKSHTIVEQVGRGPGSRQLLQLTSRQAGVIKA